MMLLVLLLQIADILSFCKIFLSASMAETGEGFSLASSGPTYSPTAAAFLSISGVKDSDSNLFTAGANPAEDDDDNVDVGSAPPLPPLLSRLDRHLQLRSITSSSTSSKLPEVALEIAAP